MGGHDEGAALGVVADGGDDLVFQGCIEMRRRLIEEDEACVAQEEPRQRHALALAARCRAQGLDARAVDDLATAVREADVISCATLSTVPLVRAEWLAPGSHLDLIGSFTPQMREADPSCFGRGARTFVDTEEALKKSGDLLDAMAGGQLRADAVQATLAQLCKGERAGRTGAQERTVFKAVGSALEDLAAATLVWQAQGERDST